ncbi:uncharacterized protein KGF55_004029 [Candida pseudojiufengensis]|uniref:uncharacterized protein n=1 Tax=Candida pseudojiufengensis TaxID=497109 RepID=UPI0022249008|nr:uncharacterized protein KGF55_004029 [Candida pseudojiufengensis]KAI5961406.1 hypothetical protein KGF55_004029 [Candida pseudojiufengensis]
MQILEVNYETSTNLGTGYYKKIRKDMIPRVKDSLENFDDSVFDDIDFCMYMYNPPSPSPFLPPEFVNFIKSEFKKNINNYGLKTVDIFDERKMSGYYNAVAKFRSYFGENFNPIKQNNEQKSYVKLFNSIFNQTISYESEIPINIFTYIFLHSFIHYFNNNSDSTTTHEEFWEKFNFEGIKIEDKIILGDLLKSFNLIELDTESNQLKESFPECLFLFTILKEELIYSHSFNMKLVEAVNQQSCESPDWISISKVFENKLTPIVFKSHFEDLKDSKKVTHDGTKFVYNEDCGETNTDNLHVDSSGNIERLNILQREFNPTGIYMKDDIYNYVTGLFKEGYYISLGGSAIKNWDKLSKDLDLDLDLHKSTLYRLIFNDSEPAFGTGFLTLKK